MFDDSSLRHQQRSSARADCGSHFRVLARAKYVAGIGEETGQLDRAGVRVNLTIGERESAWVRMHGSVREDQLELEMVQFIGPCQGQILLLAHGEVGLNGIDRGHRGYGIGRGADQIPDLNGSDAGDAIYGRGEAREFEIHGFKRGMCSFLAARAASI